MHHRIRSHLRHHSRPPLSVDKNHPVALNEMHGHHRLQLANNSFINSLNDNIESHIESTFADIRQNIEHHHQTNTCHSLRKHILGRQRATIYFCGNPFRQIAQFHHCSLFTVSSIKRNPLSAVGLTWREFKVVLADIFDANLMTWFSNSNGISSFVLPPMSLRMRSGSTAKISSFHLGLLKYLLHKNPDLYLDEIQVVLRFVDPLLDISNSTLCRVLLKMGYSSRRPSRVIGNSDFLERSLFAQAVERIVSSVHQLVFLDEATNARNCLKRFKSRGPAKIQPLGSSTVPSLRVTLLASISTEGILDFNLIAGNVTSIDFGFYLLNHVLPHMNPYPQPRSVLIMDNARVHSIRDLSEYSWQHFGVIILFLPPYSPDLNPIERVFSYCKSYFKRMVGSYPRLRQSPYVLWLLALAHCQNTVNFLNLIASTYIEDPVTLSCNVQIC